MVKKTISFGFFLLIGLSIFLFGCNTEVIPDEEPIQDDMGPSEQQPITPPADDVGVTPEDRNTIVEANNKFAFDLYSKYKTEEGNIFISPYSISTALMMTYEGAKGQTAKEMQEVLYIPENAELRRNAVSQIYNELNKEDKPYKLSTANALWSQEKFQFRKDYIDLVEKYYGGSVTNLDFVGNKESSRLVINGWVEEQTNDKIKDLIPSGALTTDTRLVLTNAIYFKGKWVKQFNENETKEQNFQIAQNNNIPVPMMQRADEKSIFNYAENNDVQLLELPYSGEDLSMLIILPKNSLENLENSFTLNQLSKWKESLAEQRVNIYIPRFKFETKYFMEKILPGMGMPTAFSNSSDFSGMEDDPSENLKIDNVVHQAFVEVNEEGTEAAAATAITIMAKATSVGSEPRIPTFRADHPFILIIQQKDTGNILFMGRVNNPSE
jgi:serpin B